MNPQLVPLHVAVPCVGGVHCVQVEPHAFTSFATHEVPQKCVPVGHTQALATHCFPPVQAKPLPQPPQLLLSLVSSTQAPLQLV